jgi:ATP-binding cassette, subfamily C, bacterial CydD
MHDRSLKIKKNKKENTAWLRLYSKRSKLWINLSIALGIASGVLLILQASVLSYAIDRVYLHGFDRSQLITPVFIFLFATLLRAFLAWAREVVGFKAASLVKLELRKRLMKHVLESKLFGHDHVGTGSVASTLLEQVDGLHDFYAHYLPQMSLAVFIPIAILAFVFPLNWVSGIILLITAPLIPFFMALVGMGAEAINQKHFQSLAKLSSHFLDVLQGLTTLKLYGRSKQQSTKIKTYADEYSKKTMAVLKVAFLSSATLEMFSSVSIALIAVYLGLVLLGDVHFGAAAGVSLHHALFILLLAPEFYLPLRQLAVHYHARAEALAAAAEIRKILEVEVNSPSASMRKDFHSTKITIQLDKLCFSYQDKVPVLDNVELEIKAGEHLAIVGPSGSGKSTLMNLLLGINNPSSGNILINNVNLQMINLASWLESVSWIGQNTRLLSGTFRENLLIAKPHATDAEIQKAIDAAHLKGLVEKLPEGLDTYIGEDNFGLSGGQVQRIALARAFLKDAPLLLLDEPTASLDQTSEKIIIDSLKELSKDRTMIIVSHREETVNFADRVFRVDNKKMLQESCEALYE